MPVDMFLKIEGVPGESKDAKHKDEIEIESFSWGLAQQEGKVVVQNFQLAKILDKASPILMLSAAFAKQFGEAVITCVKAGEKPFEFLLIKMKPVFITSYQIGGSAGDVLPSEQFSLAFEQITQTYTEQKEDGSAGSTVETTFNVREVKRA